MPGRLEPEPVPRRDFLGLAGLWTAAIAVVGSVIGMARLPKPRVIPEISTRFRVGKPAEFIPGESRIITEQNVRLVTTREGIAAMSMVCTHLGCIVKESTTGFACPCHGSKFDDTGRVTGGPAPKGLIWIELSVSPEGGLMADTLKEIDAGAIFDA